MRPPCSSWCCSREPTPSPPGTPKPISKQPTGTPTPSVTPSKTDEQPQIPPIPESLPSQADKTFAACPKFRIVLIGNSGVGKSSLVRNIFNIDPSEIDIAHGRAGVANIEDKYESHQNPRFILHDSNGFEPGSKVNWETVEKFLRDRHKKALPERIHAIWFCVETPRTGMRLLERGDEKLLELAKELKITIIAVFTKYDLLVRQFHVEGMSEKEANLKASEAFEKSAHKLKESQIRCVRISNMGSGAQETFHDLTTVTREKLREVEDELLAPWITAQQVDAHQKVDLTISEGFKKYWLDLAHSSAFDGEILIDCVHRIHDDVLKAWNFNDPTKILSGTDFFTEMIALVKPLIDDQVNLSPHPVPLSRFGAIGAKPLASLLDKFGFSTPAINYLYGKYQPYPSTAKFLATYIVNLILVMHRVFADILRSDPPRALSEVLVTRVLKGHKADLKNMPIEKIKSVSDAAANPDGFIKSAIRNRLGFDKTEDNK